MPSESPSRLKKKPCSKTESQRVCLILYISLIPQVLDRPIYSTRLSEWQYWLITIGFLGFFWVLTIAGFIQGQSWLRGIPEINVVPLLRPYFMGRAVFGAMIVISGIVQAYNIFKTVAADTRHRVSMDLMRNLSETEVAS